MEIKVNLPKDEASYRTGNGEGCWAQIDGDAVTAYESDAHGEFTAVLENDSVYWPGLGCGTTVPIEMRGENRPVVPIGWLEDKGWEG